MFRFQAKILPSLTLLLFGGISIVSGILVINFPETFNIKLPDTIEEAENIGKVNEGTEELQIFRSVDDKSNVSWRFVQYSRILFVVCM